MGWDGVGVDGGPRGGADMTGGRQAWLLVEGCGCLGVRVEGRGSGVGVGPAGGGVSSILVGEAASCPCAGECGWLVWLLVAV